MTNRLGPYELNTIVTGECSALMVALPDGCIDLTVTSPPYDSLRTYNGYTFDFEPIARQLWRVTKAGGVVVWVVGDATENGSETLTSFRQALYFRELGFNVHDTMIYQSDKPPLTQNRYEQCFEFMFVFSKGIPKTFGPIKETTIHNGTVFSKKGRGASLQQGASMRKGQDATAYICKPEKVKQNIWHFKTGRIVPDSERFIFDHPAIFPEALARDHILSWSNPGDVVLDPLIGSGTTAKQAHLLGRHYLGFEISEEYCELARRRVANVEAQPFLMPVGVETNGKPTQAKLLP